MPSGRSGDYRQYIMKDGRRFSHIIDARTGRPVTGGAISVSVFAPTCALADGLATTISIIGYDEVVLLGYRDSGMPDSADNANPLAFCNQPEHSRSVSYS